MRKILVSALLLITLGLAASLNIPLAPPALAARNFTNASDKLQVTSFPVDISTQGTLAFWYYPTTSSSDGVTHVPFVWNNGTSSFYVAKSSDGKWYTDWYSPGRTIFSQSVDGSYCYEANKWNLFITRWNSTHVESRWKCPGGDFTAGPFADDLAGRWNTSTTTKFIIGNDTADTSVFKGRIAWFTVWSQVYSTDLMRNTVYKLNANPGDYPLPMWDTKNVRYSWVIDGVVPDSSWYNSDGSAISLTLTGASYIAGDPLGLRLSRSW